MFTPCVTLYAGASLFDVFTLAGCEHEVIHVNCTVSRWEVMETFGLLIASPNFLPSSDRVTWKASVNSHL